MVPKDTPTDHRTPDEREQLATVRSEALEVAVDLETLARALREVALGEALHLDASSVRGEINPGDGVLRLEYTLNWELLLAHARDDA